MVNTSTKSTKRPSTAFTSPNSSKGNRSSAPLTAARPNNIMDLLNIDGNRHIESAITAHVVYLQEFMPIHKHVLKNRRRTVLVDNSGYINAFIHRDDDVFFEEGDTISVEGFKMKDKTILIHENTFIIP